MKRFFRRAVEVLGVEALRQRLHRRDLLVLCYHGVVTTGNPRFGNTVSLAEFRRHMSILARWFRPVSAEEVRNWVEGGLALGDRPAMITFDDGYRDNLTVAAPVLKEFGFPALFFVTTGYVGTARQLWTQEIIDRVCAWPGPALRTPRGDSTISLPSAPEARWDLAASLKEKCKLIRDRDRVSFLEYLRQGSPLASSPQDEDTYAFLSWGDVRTLSEQGFEIGSHTVEHPSLRQLDSEALDRELCASKAAIEAALGRECPYIAYPFGDAQHYSDEVISHAAAAGYFMGFAVTGRFHSRRRSPLAIARVHVPEQLPRAVFHRGGDQTQG